MYKQKGISTFAEKMMKDTLYIIGNGFDLNHGLRTSYANFRDDYLKKKNYKLWNELRDIYSDSSNLDLWRKDFESMLGKMDYAHLGKTYNGLALDPTKIQNLLKFQLPPLFGYWIKSLNTNSKTDESLKIDTNSLFFHSTTPYF